jgi:hypothetical protein
MPFDPDLIDFLDILGTVSTEIYRGKNRSG